METPLFCYSCGCPVGYTKSSEVLPSILCMRCGGNADEESEEPDEDEPMRYLNFYECTHEDRLEAGQPPCEWDDVWSCMCNDKCPVCNAEIEPYRSEELPEE